MGDTASVNPESPEESHFEYSTVSGFFLQDEPDTDPDNFDFTQTNFGLIDQAYDTDDSLPPSPSPTTATAWQRFDHKLSTLNEQSDRDTAYKLLFLGRHGQGDHNVAEAFYGSKAWDCYYSTLPGNGTLNWTDAHLTDLGVSQADTVSRFWRSQIQIQKMPPPDLYFSSPLTRAIHTAQLTFSPLDKDLLFPPTQKFRCQILESLRECIGIHTCDQRSTRSVITHHFPPPTFTIVPPFSEDDTLWTPDLRESPGAQTGRLRRCLDHIFLFEKTTKKYISVTSHGGTIMAVLRAVKHREFSVPTGGVIPVLIRIEQKRGKRPEEKVEPWLPREDCGDVHR